MIEIKGSKDCGNSPKNKFVQDLAVSLETSDLAPENFAEDVVWHGVTPEPIHGRINVERQLAKRTRPAAIVIEHAIAHGAVGAASGEQTLSNGRKRRFNHIFEFTSAKANRVAVIKSYA